MSWDYNKTWRDLPPDIESRARIAREHGWDMDPDGTLRKENGNAVGGLDYGAATRDAEQRERLRPFPDPFSGPRR